MTACTAERARSGFTMVEVLASLALVAVILPVAMQGISLAMGAADLARDRIEAGGLAEAKLNEVLADGSWQNGDESDDYGTERPGWNWALTVEDWSGTTIQLVEVTVTWKSRGRERSVAIATLASAGSA
jgi:type II secretion system protein I